MNRENGQQGGPAGYRDLAEALRQEIVAGDWDPGQRLPPRRELAAHLNSSQVTLQRAIDELVEAGFVETAGRRGTFVSQDPPHLFDFGVVFESGLVHGRLPSRFMEAMRRVVADYQGPLRLRVFTGVSPGLRSAEFLELENLVRTQRLAGLIFCHAPFRLQGSPILEQPGIPRVAVMSRPDQRQIPVVTPETTLFLDRALSHLAAVGCQRPAVFLGGGGSELSETVYAVVERLGMERRPDWIIRIAPQLPETAQDVTRLLFSRTMTEQPDGLVIADDHLAEAAGAGMLATGTRPLPKERVISLANFPDRPQPPIPMTFMGCDVRVLMHTCIAVCNRLRQGQSVPAKTRIDARYEDEIDWQQQPQPAITAAGVA